MAHWLTGKNRTVVKDMGRSFVIQRVIFDIWSSQFHDGNKEAGTLESLFFIFHSWVITNYAQILKGPFILWLHLSATTLIIPLCNLPYLWCSGGKTFSLCNLKGHPDWVSHGECTCFAVEQAGFMTGEFFADVLLKRSLGLFQ